jgi:hypothetical protein
VNFGFLLNDKEALMAVRTWQTIKLHYCDHVKQEVGLEAQVIYPADIMPDQPPRVTAKRCSHGFACNLDDRPSCVWAGTNPSFDPFAE